MSRKLFKEVQIYLNHNILVQKAALIWYQILVQLMHYLVKKTMEVVVYVTLSILCMVSCSCSMF